MKDFYREATDKIRTIPRYKNDMVKKSTDILFSLLNSNDSSDIQMSLTSTT